MGKTIITYLIDSDPKGSQYLSIRGDIYKMYIIPRSDITILNKREELQTPSFYILLGEDENVTLKAYIGETENFKERVKDHDNKKSFWQKAFIFITTDNSITKADVQYLEFLALKCAKKSNYYSLNENKQIPKAPSLPEYQKDYMDNFFINIKFLTSFAGCNIFQEIKMNNKNLFFTKSSECDAKGFYDSSGFTVLKDSIIATKTTPSFKWNQKRDEIIGNIATLKDNKLILNSDFTFSSPSTAAAFCLGRSSNGWTDWKDSKCKTLDEVYRKALT